MISGLTERIIINTNKNLDREEELYDLGCPSDIKELFETAKEAQRFAEKFACERGFIIVQRGGSDATRVRLKCDKGNTHHAKARRVRNSTSRQTNCPYRLNIRKGANGRWKFLELNRSHNHPATNEREMAVHSRARLHCTTEQQREEILNLAAAAIPPRNIIQAVRANHPSIRIDSKDIGNLVGSARLKELNGQSPINCLVRVLVETGTFHRVGTDSQNQVTHLFYAFEDGIRLLRRSGVILLDSTYKTNRYQMPMLHGVGITATYQTFSAFVAFMRAEREDNYRWALSCFRSLLEANDIRPEVMVTDREMALMNAIKAEFPHVKNLLCIWHINHNIAAKYKASFSGEQWNNWIKRWNSILHMATCKEFDDAMKDLLEGAEYATPLLMRQYVTTTWLPLRDQFARPWTKHYRHFGTTATSRAEAAHARIKKYIGVSTGDLLFVSNQILAAHKAEIEMIICTIGRQMQRESPLFATDIYRLVRKKVSWHALQMVAEQLRLVKAATKNPANYELGQCTSKFFPSINT